VGGNYNITAEAMEVLLSYDWPGNVRELENCVQHMAAINSGPLLHLGDLPSNLRNFLTEKKAQYLMAAAGTPFTVAPPGDDGSPAASTPAPAAAQNAPVVVPLLELERRAIVNALEYTKGDRSVAAHLLGIGRTTLYRKLKEYQLDS
jgi:two-component system response regulator HydG